MFGRFVPVVAIALLIAGCQSASDQSNQSMVDSSRNAPPPVTAPTTPVTSARTPEEGLQQAGNTIYFTYDGYSLDLTARAVVERQAQFLAENPTVTVTIEGHCDERGTREYNLALGDRRANAVKDYLTSLGINPSRMQTISYGEERPIAAGSNENAWADNRRAVTVVTSGRLGS